MPSLIDRVIDWRFLLVYSLPTFSQEPMNGRSVCTEYVGFVDMNDVSGGLGMPLNGTKRGTKW